MSIQTLPVIETAQLETEALSWPDKAKAVAITDQATYTSASQMLIGIKGLRKQIDETFDGPIQKAFQAHRAIIDSKRKVEAPLIEAERIIKDGISAFEIEQRRIQQEAERKAMEESERQAEQLRLENAVAAEQMGASAEVVEEILESPIPVVPAPVAPTFQRAEGISTRASYKAQVTDIKALCRAVAEGKASVECVMPNMPVLNGLARSLKSTMQIPGVRVITDTIVNARAR